MALFSEPIVCQYIGKNGIRTVQKIIVNMRS